MGCHPFFFWILFSENCSSIITMFTLSSIFDKIWLKAFSSAAGPAEPWFSLFLFFAASGLMIQRLEMMEQQGLEGTVLGTLIMPYCSGISNLIFAFVMGRTGGNGSLVLENCLVNNVTNLTLLIGLPAMFWAMSIVPPNGKNGKKKKISKKVAVQYKINHLSLLLTLTALVFFTGVTWALARDGSLNFGDGLVLVMIFLFWQIFHVYDVSKQNIMNKQSLSWFIVLDLAIILLAGYGIYVSVEGLVAWIPKEGEGLFVFDSLGWLSGILMVIPNALLAFYYAANRRIDIVYSSQLGDGHICIPLCIGIFALFCQVQIPDFFNIGVLIIIGSGLVHFFFIAAFKRLPKFMGLALTLLYGYFLYSGFFAAFL